MSIFCGTCGHKNQEDAAFCDECGEELTTDALSSEAESTIPSEEANVDVCDRESSYDMEVDVDVDTSLHSESESIETEQPDKEPTSLPVAAATRLEVNEPPIQPIISPPTTLELPELPTAVLIDRETGAKFTIPPEEKTAYIGRINEQFPIQIDLSGITHSDLISRVHAAIHYENEIYYLEDAGSANGTWLNEVQLQSGTRFRQELNPGDTIAFGRSQTVKLTFDLEE